jgi:methyl coenzyme M reductase subunit C-like uncharacterized protein (methanogenesis marker protein 7)
MEELLKTCFRVLSGRSFCLVLLLMRVKDDVRELNEKVEEWEEVKCLLGRVAHLLRHEEDNGILIKDVLVLSCEDLWVF